MPMGGTSSLRNVSLAVVVVFVSADCSVSDAISNEKDLDGMTRKERGSFRFYMCPSFVGALLASLVRCCVAALGLSGVGGR